MNFGGKVIDGHMHFFKMFDENGKTMFEKYDEYQEKYGFKAINLCSIPFGYADISNNILAAMYKLHNPTAYAYGGITFDTFPVKIPVKKGLEPETQYEELMEIGFDGVKLYDCKPKELKMLGIFPDNPFYEKMFAKAEKEGTHIIWHVGDPETFWDIEKAPEWTHRQGYFYGDGTYPSNKEIYDAVLRVLQKHPKLNVTFAHFFFWSDYPERLVDLFEKYENVSIDLVPGSEMYAGILENYDFYKDFFVKYADRIQYGTDITFPVNEPYWETLVTEVYNSVATDKDIEIYCVKGKGLDLPKEVCDKILKENFLRTSKCPTPKSINKKALKKYIEKYAYLIEDKRTKEYILKCAENY